MSPVRISILVVAAIAAIGLAFMVRGMAGGGEAPPAAVATIEKPMAKVLVASRDLPIGARLVAEDLSWQDWPLDAVNEVYITDGSVVLPERKPDADVKADPRNDADDDDAVEDDKEKTGDEKVEEKSDAEKTVAAVSSTLFGEGGPKAALTGAVVREALLRGDPITERKLVRAGQSGFMAVVLSAGMRAMAIPVSVESAAGGFILPGDRVDVLLSRSVASGAANGGTEFKTHTVMRNVKVLAIDQVTRPEDGAQSVVGATATLEVGAYDAEALAEADAQGDLALVLRSYADISGPTGRAARPQIAARSESAGNTVRVWRDGSPTAVVTP